METSSKSVAPLRYFEAGESWVNHIAIINKEEQIRSSATEIQPCDDVTDAASSIAAQGCMSLMTHAENKTTIQSQTRMAFRLFYDGKAGLSDTRRDDLESFSKKNNVD